MYLNHKHFSFLKHEQKIFNFHYCYSIRLTIHKNKKWTRRHYQELQNSYLEWNQKMYVCSPLQWGNHIQFYFYYFLYMKPWRHLFIRVMISLCLKTSMVSISHEDTINIKLPEAEGQVQDQPGQPNVRIFINLYLCVHVRTLTLWCTWEG